MNKFFWNFITFFCGLFILTFEFEYSIFPEIYKYINPLFENLVQLTGVTIFSTKLNFDPTISSDTIGLYYHVFNLLWISVALSFLLDIFQQFNKVNLRPYLLLTLTYYLSLQLLIYGFDKLFKAQFFMPEPNTLHTPLKDLSKDILYWSTIGLSRGYSMFLGGAEIIVGILLWFRKTRLIAAILGLGIMINVVAVNFGFDISVKIYSLFLLICFFLILIPYLNYLYVALILKEKKQSSLKEFVFLERNPIKKKALKLGVILLFIIEGLFPYIKTGNFNDDSFPRPEFHGAYLIEENELGLKRMFIHRQGYLIFQNEKDEFYDYQLEIDTKKQFLTLTDYQQKESFKINFNRSKNKINKIQGHLFDTYLNFTLKKVTTN